MLIFDQLYFLCTSSNGQISMLFAKRDRPALEYQVHNSWPRCYRIDQYNH